MCTSDIPQKVAAQVLALNLLLFLLFEPLSQTELFSNYELFMYVCFCLFFHSYGSFNHTNSTSLSFSEFSELFISILLLSQLIESHFALSSARCHFSHHHVSSSRILHALCFLVPPSCCFGIFSSCFLKVA